VSKVRLSRGPFSLMARVHEIVDSLANSSKRVLVSVSSVRILHPEIITLFVLFLLHGLDRRSVLIHSAAIVRSLRAGVASLAELSWVAGRR